MKISAAFLLLTILSTTLKANQPPPFSFDFFSNRVAYLPPGKASITWGIGKDPFGDRNKNQTIEGKKFVVSLMNLFEEVLYSDTVDSPVMNITMNKEEHVLFKVVELGASQETTVVFTCQGVKPLPQMKTSIDSLNFLLANGYFANALAVLYQMNRADLSAKVIERYHLLFPFEYRGSKEIFNSYYDPTANDLLQMPYVTNSKSFLKKLKDAKLPKLKRFEIQATIASDNSITILETTSPVDKAALLNALSVLQINTHNVNPAKLVLIVDTKKWKLINSRALTDPSSAEFKLRPRIIATGAVHR